MYKHFVRRASKKQTWYKVSFFHFIYFFYLPFEFCNLLGTINRFLSLPFIFEAWFYLYLLYNLYSFIIISIVYFRTLSVSFFNSFTGHMQFAKCYQMTFVDFQFHSVRLTFVFLFILWFLFRNQRLHNSSILFSYMINPIILNCLFLNIWQCIW